MKSLISLLLIVSLNAHADDISFVKQLEPVTVGASVLPTGAATSAAQTTAQTTLDNIKAKTDNLDVLLSTRTKKDDIQNIRIGDSPSRDSFGRLRVSNPTGIFDSQFTYDLQPLLFEQKVAGSGATVTHDATNRNVKFTFAATPNSGTSYLQSYQYFRYQPNKSHNIGITFGFESAVTGVTKFARYGDASNSVTFQNNGTVNQVAIYSTTAVGNQIKNQSDWNLDCLCDPALNPGSINPSGKRLDITKDQQLRIDIEALYVGRVRIGFDMDGEPVYVHQFLMSNTQTAPYIATANLPIAVGMINNTGGNVSTTMHFNCSSVVSEGGTDKTVGFEFAQDFSITAASGVLTHALSIRPKALFNGLSNRESVYFIEIDMLVVGTNPVEWQLCLGQAITGTTAFIDVNTTYSGVEYNTLGTASGACTIVMDESYVPSSVQSRGNGQMDLTFRYPITLDAAGVARPMGTISLVAAGIGGASAIRGALKWTEVR